VQKNPVIFRDLVSIKPQYSTLYTEIYSNRKREVSETSLKNLVDNRQSGLISKKANKKLYDSIDWMLYISKEKLLHNYKFNSNFIFKLNMITLTLPTKQMNSDNYIKNKMLNNFLTILRTRFDLSNYIWKAEKTQAGNLHFHILSDIYIHYRDINNIWNRILSTHGYIAEYRDKMNKYFENGFRMFTNAYDKRGKQQQIKAYKNGLRTDWSEPTGTTDIHSLRKINNVKAYVSKYLGKNMDTKRSLAFEIEKYCKENNLQNITATEYDEINNKIYNKLKVSGNIWYISQSLSKLTGAITDTTIKVTDELTKIFTNYPDRILKFDYCTVIKIPVSEFIKKGLYVLKNIFDKHIEELRNIVSSPPLLQLDFKQ
jgi:hypothetical protein